MTRLNIILSLLFLQLILACGSDKEVPSAPSSNDSEQNDSSEFSQKRNSSQHQDGPIQYFGWGAPVGTTEALRKLAECNEMGVFFDRAYDQGAGACDPQRIVPYNCKDIPSVAQGLGIRADQQANLEKLLGAGGNLAGYQIDQCTDEGDKYQVHVLRQGADGTIQLSAINISY